MSNLLRLKNSAKKLRWKIRRTAVGIRWGLSKMHQAPIVIGNSMPKSGSHLIIQVLEGLTRVGPFVDTGMPPLNRHIDNSVLSNRDILKRIDELQCGDIAYSYLKASDEFINALTRPGSASIFIYRDPRDMIVSHVFYATDLNPRHSMHEYYSRELSSMEERINAAILGVVSEDHPLSDILHKYSSYLDWLDLKDSLSIRFEDLILYRDQTLGRILDYLSTRGYISDLPKETVINNMKDSIQPKKSGTFRKAKPGNWREYFTGKNIDTFKAKTGDLLIKMGYESDRNWS
jgi:hypothetical protein